MTKVNFLRKIRTEKYNENDLSSAVEIGEVLLREHWHNKSFFTRGYADDLFNLACLHEEIGNLERAAELFSDSARQISAVEGENLNFAERLSGLARVLMQLGICEPAFFMFGNVVNIFRREGVQNLLYADCLYNYANAAADIQRKSDAIECHAQALEIRKKNQAPAEDIVNSLHSLAFVHEADSEHEKAAFYASAAVKYSFGNNHNHARACNYLAGLYENSQKYENALALYEKVMRLVKREVGKQHSSYLNVALRRANLLSLMNKLHESLDAHEEIRDVFARVSGTRHIFYANCLRGMAMLQKNLNFPADAENSIMEAMKIRRTMKENISLDIAFLIRLHLHENNIEKAFDALIYALMCSSREEFCEFQNLFTELLSITKTPTSGDFVNTIELVNDKEKLRPIIQKWTAWENES
ncbi:MAG: tetratricopeptide repeat protein [Defluviitaleaceae bacterium]|nr:tetratricopeptide repeat protein [Defluviitaleaceae bacterium]